MRFTRLPVGVSSVTAVALLAVGVTVAPARAVDFDKTFRLVDEIRVGGATHDLGTREERGADIVAEVLSSPIYSARSGSAFFDWFLSPRLHLGTSVNTAGRTDLVYAGFTWRWKVADRFFIDGNFGGAWNDSPEHKREHQFAMGCPVTFHEGVDFGARLTDHVDLLVGVSHASHAGLCGKTNPGLTQIEAKVGYRF